MECLGRGDRCLAAPRSSPCVTLWAAPRGWKPLPCTSQNILKGLSYYIGYRSLCVVISLKSLVYVRVQTRVSKALWLTTAAGCPLNLLPTVKQVTSHHQSVSFFCPLCDTRLHFCGWSRGLSKMPMRVVCRSDDTQCIAASDCGRWRVKVATWWQQIYVQTS